MCSGIVARRWEGVGDKGRGGGWALVMGRLVARLFISRDDAVRPPRERRERPPINGLVVSSCVIQLVGDNARGGACTGSTLLKIPALDVRWKKPKLPHTLMIGFGASYKHDLHRLQLWMDTS